MKSRVREGYKKAFFGKGKKLIDSNVFIFRIDQEKKISENHQKIQNVGRSIHGQEMSKRYVREVKSQGDCSFSSESQITYLLTKRTLKKCFHHLSSKNRYIDR